MVRAVACQVSSFVFFVVGYGTFLGAFGTDYWIDDEEGNHWGLWRICKGAFCTRTVGNDIFTVSFIGAQALFCVTLILGAVSLGSYIAWLATRGERTCVIAWATSLSAGFCDAIGIILWANESLKYYNSNVLAWSFWINLGSCILIIIDSGLTACTTGCGTKLDDPYDGAIYGPGPATRGIDVPLRHDPNVSDYSDITQSEYSMGNVNYNSRNGPPFSRPPPNRRF